MKKIYLFSILSILVIFVKAQPGAGMQVINSTGGSSENAGYILEWSIGELASIDQMNAEDGKYILTNGFVQPLQSAYRNLGQFISSNNVRIYPNPASEIIQVDMLQNISGTITMQLSDSKGQVMYRREVTIYGYGHVEKISIKHFPQGEYTLYLQRIIPGSVLYESQPAVFKIIKF